jgi:hypothetical protein
MTGARQCGGQTESSVTLARFIDELPPRRAYQ